MFKLPLWQVCSGPKSIKLPSVRRRAVHGGHAVDVVGPLQPLCSRVLLRVVPLAVHSVPGGAVPRGGNASYHLVSV